MTINQANPLVSVVITEYNLVQWYIFPKSKGDYTGDESVITRISSTCRIFDVNVQYLFQSEKSEDWIMREQRQNI